ncbi:hypothetical protein E3N88_45787 [Mikania micrantha]|uniref:Uncharacterized protein n=1 Tax=Mikania micrantha TaxID=192012 RepID=A0A5N6LAG8_9ASTR|nr:hypothetical protein E3N88_45787 [Mikania micrantha]
MLLSPGHSPRRLSSPSPSVSESPAHQTPGSSNSLLTPTSTNPRKRNPSTVLDEDTYVAAIEKIIQRDFFPDVPKLRDRLDWLEATRTGDPGRWTVMPEIKPDVIIISSDDEDDYSELDGHESDKEEKNDIEKSNAVERLDNCGRSNSFNQGLDPCSLGFWEPEIVNWVPPVDGLELNMVRFRGNFASKLFYFHTIMEKNLLVCWFLHFHCGKDSGKKCRSLVIGEDDGTVARFQINL